MSFKTKMKWLFRAVVLTSSAIIVLIAALLFNAYAK